ncbi:MAG: hypothetical protein QOK21_3749 [Solirubrobacteraceae bacterium]|jgi:hypothetical protein|nr:hypothetical protein [Solirubrobacteraceae bacterium]
MTDAQTLHPAEHRGLRELQAAARHLAGHWRRLASRLPGEPAELLERGAVTARELAAELRGQAVAYDVEVFPAAQLLGARGAGLRGAGDVLLERNQAMRAAVLDAQHVTTLLGYLSEIAERRGDVALTTWEREWRERFETLETDARATATSLGASPDAAIEPAEPSALGRAGHAVAMGVGTLGEAIDRSALGRMARGRRVSGAG